MPGLFRIGPESALTPGIALGQSAHTSLRVPRAFSMTASLPSLKQDSKVVMMGVKNEAICQVEELSWG